MKSVHMIMKAEKSQSALCKLETQEAYVSPRRGQRTDVLAQAGREVNFPFLHFCSVQTLSGWDSTQLHWGGQSNLQSLLHSNANFTWKQPQRRTRK